MNIFIILLLIVVIIPVIFYLILNVWKKNILIIFSTEKYL